MASISQYKYNNDYVDSVDSNDQSAQGSGNTFTMSSKIGSHALQVNGSGYAAKTSGVTGITTGNHDRSFGGWVFVSDNSVVQGWFSLGTAAGSQGHLIILLSSTSIRVDLYGDALSFTIPALSNNTWYWIWTEYTSADKSSRIFVNNVESSSGLQAHAGNSNLQFGSIRTGADTDNGNLAPNGTRFDDFRVYDRVITSSERGIVYNGGNGTEGNEATTTSTSSSTSTTTTSTSTSTTTTSTSTTTSTTTTHSTSTSTTTTSTSTTTTSTSTTTTYSTSTSSSTTTTSTSTTTSMTTTTSTSTTVTVPYAYTVESKGDSMKFSVTHGD